MKNLLTAILMVLGGLPLASEQYDVTAISEDASGNKVQRDINITPAAETILDDASIGAMRTTLDVYSTTAVDFLFDDPESSPGWSLSAWIAALEDGDWDFSGGTVNGVEQSAISDLSDSLSRRAMVGGGWFDGASGDVTLSSSVSFEAGTSLVWSGVIGESSGSGRSLFSDGSGTTKWIGYADGAGYFWLRDSSSTVLTGSEALTSAETGEVAMYAIVYSSDGSTIYIYRNGEVFDTLDASGFGSLPISQIGRGYNTPEYQEGSWSGFAALNYALSSSEVESIAEKGLVPWWSSQGRPTGGERTSTDDWDEGSSTWSSLTVDAAGFDGTADGSSRAGQDYTDLVGQRVRLQFSVDTLTSSPIYVGFIDADPSGSLVGAWVSEVVSSVGGTPTVANNAIEITSTGDIVAVFDLPSSVSDALLARFTCDVTGDVTVSGLRLDAIGPMSLLPMDEGIGYQLHDLTGNHNYGLLSVSGTQHLIPKTAGYVADYSVDPYDGGSGSNVYLVSSTRRTLPDNAIVTGLAYLTSSGGTVSQVEMGRSNLTGYAQMVESTTAVGAAGYAPVGETNQSPSNTAIAVRSSDADATDMNFKVPYIVIGN